MKILHTESSPGWGGQELRILREAEGMRKRGHEVVLAVQKGGGLVAPARAAGLTLYELDFRRRRFFSLLAQLARITKRHRIQVINTHSSLDAWCGGIVGKMRGCYVIRTRHLSTPIRPGLNSWLLYNALTHKVVTTCSEVVEVIEKQARLKKGRCCSIPTGVDPLQIVPDEERVAAFRRTHGIAPDDLLVGTLCVLRGWKGVADLIHAAKILENEKQIKWIVVGSGPSEAYFKGVARTLGVEERIIFTGHLSPPFDAVAAMDIFALLSWSHEGVSQASLQAAYLKRPLITTPTGGLKEVCLDRQTGLLVECCAPQQVADAVLTLASDPTLRETLGEAAHRIVESKFLFEHTLDAMERVVQGQSGSHQTSPTPSAPPL